MNIEVIGISRDLGPSQQKFKETVNAKNTFLSDPDAKVISAYGALSAQRVANRYYFLIDENGKLIWKRESWWQRILHNETAYQVQRRLQWKGLPMTVIPLRVR